MTFNILLFILLLCNYLITANLKDKYKKLVKGTNGKNIEGILLQHKEEVDEVRSEFQQFNRRLDLFDNRLSFCVQKIGIIRYNAFKDTGSDLSFSIAMLDDNNDGLIITGIHGRTETISYAKPIKEGKSNYSLSVEELQALERAKAKEIDGLEMKSSRRSKEVV
ncbi:DUF4446 family protein [Alkaliphilus serpentinus]|uniref:DUF4446 family protein n=2 Tax=Alkaliphilus serpentinus TaxID=1482731 RepID=A0A833HQX4_9FIRM|nr:DUF4446 family protein [Alkaliphilus serpentinus]